MKKIGIHKLYRKNAEEAEKKLFGASGNRRGFLKKSAVVAMGSVLGAPVVFGKNYPSGMIPAALANSSEPFNLPGKDPGLVVLNDRPINAETPPHLLNDNITPGDKLFVRNNGIPPELEEINVDQWTLTIEGESAAQKKTYTLAELKSKFKHHTYQITLECGGNGRSEYNPPATGNQWTTGAIGCPEWTGVRLKDVLEDVGIKDDAVYIGYYGNDSHISGQPDKVVISRGVPMEKALKNESLIAWAMNGEDIPYLNGHPLRLLFGGWPASCSGKWLSRIVIRNKVHDGPKMTGKSYRVPCKPVAPGTEVADEDMCIIEAMPVKSLITYPKTGAIITLGEKLPIKGHAWAGDTSIQKVEYSIDFGATWNSCNLKAPVNMNAWQHFDASVSFPEKGYYEVWARATDAEDVSQPMVVPGWNPRGYLNNACHRIAIKVQ
ncbi:sulfite oxidase [Membranihabitans maritimus]|uniref:sulfite oxidase n=1 Tax=Membranihabitans maritimus TaxID=2904244 RepID=UPI001F3A9ACE|nr:sulfite oxidase [Membranihabitans maritimus]